MTRGRKSTLTREQREKLAVLVDRYYRQFGPRAVRLLAAEELGMKDLTFEQVRCMARKLGVRTDSTARCNRGRRGRQPLTMHEVRQWLVSGRRVKVQPVAEEEKQKPAKPRLTEEERLALCRRW